MKSYNPNEVRTCERRAVLSVCNYCARIGAELNATDFMDQSNGSLFRKEPCYSISKAEPYISAFYINDTHGSDHFALMAAVPTCGKWAKRVKALVDSVSDSPSVTLSQYFAHFLFLADALLACESDESCEFVPMAVLEDNCRQGASIDVSEREIVLQKVSKLMALADKSRNNSAEEATSAALHAQRLMARYNLTHSDLHPEEAEEPILASIGIGMSKEWAQRLVAVIANNFACFAYLNRLKCDSITGKNCAYFFGRKENALAARRVYLYLYETGHRLANEETARYRNKYGSATGIYTSFAYGFLKGVDMQLSQQCQALQLIPSNETCNQWAGFCEQMGMISPKYRKKAKLFRGAYQSGLVSGIEAVNAQSIPTAGISAECV